jgi:hypothetical protein
MRIGFGDDRRKPGLDLGQFLRALQRKQLQLGLVALGRVGNDLVDDRGDRTDQRFE